MLRILDFNVWSGLTYLGYLKMGTYGDASFLEKRRSVMLELIRQLDPDIVCLHELNPLPRAGQSIATELEMDSFYHLHLGGMRIGSVGLPWNLREGDGIFAKKSLRMKPVGRMQLSGGYVGRFASFHFSDATQIIGVQIEISGKSLPIFTTHWHAGVTPGPDIEEKAENLILEEKIPRTEIEKTLHLMRKNAHIRLLESEKTLSFMSQHPGGCILTGDFNSRPNSEEIKKLTDSGLTDAYSEMHPGEEGATWNYAENTNHQKFYSEYDPNLYLRLNYTRLKIPHRLDYIFYRPGAGLSLNRCEIVMKEAVDGVQASDHFGVLAEFEI